MWGVGWGGIPKQNEKDYVLQHTTGVNLDTIKYSLLDIKKFVRDYIIQKIFCQRSMPT